MLDYADWGRSRPHSAPKRPEGKHPGMSSNLDEHDMLACSSVEHSPRLALGRSETESIHDSVHGLNIMARIKVDGS